MRYRAWVGGFTAVGIRMSGFHRAPQYRFTAVRPLCNPLCGSAIVYILPHSPRLVNTLFWGFLKSSVLCTAFVLFSRVLSLVPQLRSPNKTTFWLSCFLLIVGASLQNSGFCIKSADVESLIVHIFSPIFAAAMKKSERIATLRSFLNKIQWAIFV